MAVSNGNCLVLDYPVMWYLGRYPLLFYLNSSSIPAVPAPGLYLIFGMECGKVAVCSGGLVIKRIFLKEAVDLVTELVEQ
ncbi:hypothetical protein DYBT9275_02895 [Dyadobacter sp. CECT 9275]|uniref:Uncharacterized protein n=1 Tax=Dyadobacter helix TaxID=2822344 RepID=A0A916JBN5_9BACT|nr:hypothetical protein DYBT9275_02895 [Dyadobacter sp. CECT 9275]